MYRRGRGGPARTPLVQRRPRPGGVGVSPTWPRHAGWPRPARTPCAWPSRCNAVTVIVARLSCAVGAPNTVQRHDRLGGLLDKYQQVA